MKQQPSSRRKRSSTKSVLRLPDLELPKTIGPLLISLAREATFELFRFPIDVLENPGQWFFPPLASLITSAGRLLLALLERKVTDAGGVYMATDTDAMSIASTEKGGLVPCAGGHHKLPDGREAVKALSWKEVLALVDEFSALNPTTARL